MRTCASPVCSIAAARVLLSTTGRRVIESSFGKPRLPVAGKLRHLHEIGLIPCVQLIRPGSHRMEADLFAVLFSAAGDHRRGRVGQILMNAENGCLRVILPSSDRALQYWRYFYRLGA